MNLKELQFLFKPKYWIMFYQYDKEIDKLINDLLDKYELTDIDSVECTCKLGKAIVWIGNIPYCCGYLYETPVASKRRPSRLTIQRLAKRFYEARDKLHKQQMKKLRDDFQI